VAVDIREGSPTFGEWVGENLSAENHKLLYIPVGFAPRVLLLSKTVQVVYKTSSEYSPKDEQGILWSDPQIKIKWPHGGRICPMQGRGIPFAQGTSRHRL